MTPENKPDYSKNPSARDIETSIGETRAGMSDDIKALSDKASAANVKQEVKQAIKSGKDAAVETAVETARDVKDAAIDAKNVVVDKAIEVKDKAVETAQDVAESVSETIDEVSYQTRRAGRAAWEFAQANAVPLSLLGLGAAWLVSNRRKQRSLAPMRRVEADYYDDEPDYYTPGMENDGLYGSNGSYPTGARATGSSPITTPTPSAGRTPRTAQMRAKPRSAAESAERTQRSARKVSANIKRSTHDAYDKMGDTFDRAQHSLASGMTRSRDFVKDKYVIARDASLEFADANPLALALGTLVAGVGIGLMIPGTKREDELFGPSREQLRTAIGTASDAAQDVGRVAKQTARETMASVDAMSR
jgi:hypothetical protein